MYFALLLPKIGFQLKMMQRMKLKSTYFELKNPDLGIFL
jgi:hypothetical protein